MNRSNKQLLVVEDDLGLQSQLRWCFEGFNVLIAGDRQEAVTQLHKHKPGVVTLDLGLPPDPGGVSEGLALLEEILSIAPQTKIIVVTGDNDHANAVRSIGLGAYDFYQKPIDPEILALIVERAHRVYELEQENIRLQKNRPDMPLRGIIGSSPQLLKVCRTIEKIAPSDITTLLLGASGTGKELFARALHELSSRSEQRMVAINCAAIPDNLLESELFGYEKGAFTGAAKQTKGKIEFADKGTLFLDEIGDLPLDLQAKLLRFIQERVLERVGGRQEIQVDTRIVCATHQDLNALIAEGGFREDLYYRLSEITIKIPSLKEREGDALMLAKAFLDRFSSEYDRPIRGFSKETALAIESYDWPGNVREMESQIKRTVIMSDGPLIALDDLEIPTPREKPLSFNLKQLREKAERKAILRALEHADDKITEAAKLLGVTRPTLYSLMERYGLKGTSKN